MARFIGWLVLLALVVIAIGGGIVFGPQPIGPTVTYEAVDQNWTWRYPSDWRLQSFDELVGNVTFQGALA